MLDVRGRQKVIYLEVTKKTYTYEYTEPIKLAIKYVLGIGLGEAAGNHLLPSIVENLRLFVCE